MSVNHDSAFSGHLGVKKSEVRILPNFFWPGHHSAVPVMCAKEQSRSVLSRKYHQGTQFMPKCMQEERPGETDVIQHRMKLTDDTPIRCKPYLLLYAMREELRNEVDSMLEMVVRPSKSPYVSPVIMVKKTVWF